MNSHTHTQKKSMLIMLVDDDEDDRFFFGLAIAEFGSDYEFIQAQGCEKALQLLRQAITLPDYIFIDLNMPEMNGKECLKALKDDSAFKNIPVIIYTTSVSPSDIKEIYELGAAYYFKKPMTTHSLGAKIIEALELVKEKLLSALP
ncbi:response regulator [soil metagenome]